MENFNSIIFSGKKWKFFYFCYHSSLQRRDLLVFGLALPAEPETMPARPHSRAKSKNFPFSNFGLDAF